MPPVHPAIVHFPVALLTLSVLADLFGYFYRSESLQDAGWWSLVAAAVGGALAIIAGLFDMNREKFTKKAHRQVHKHMKIGFALFAAIAVLTVWRWVIFSDRSYELNWFYLIFGCLVMALAFFQGWLGGELVFAYGVGVAPTGQGSEPRAEARKRVEEIIGGKDQKQEHRH